MEIPTIEQFAVLSKRLSGHRRTALDAERAHCRRAMLADEGAATAACASYLRCVAESKEQDRTLAASLYAYKWMASNPSFKHLQTSLRKSIRSKTIDAWCQAEASRIATELMSRPEKRRKEWLWNRLRHVENTPANGALAGIAEGLSRYFYGVPERRADTSSELARHLTAALRKFDFASEALSSFAQVEGFARKELQARIEGLKRWIEMQQERMAVRVSCVPVGRRDSTARERWLMHDLSRTFLENFRTEKPSAIAHVLSFHGIENAISDRAIEKQLAKWKVQRAAWNAVSRKYEKGKNY